MKKYFTISILILISCQNDDSLRLENTCSVDNPIEELEWLREEIQQLISIDSDLYRYFYISQATYENETVFIFDNCCPFCNSIVLVKNCKGETIGALGSEIDHNSISDELVVWKPANYQCSK